MRRRVEKRAMLCCVAVLICGIVVAIDQVTPATEENVNMYNCSYGN